MNIRAYIHKTKELLYPEENGDPMSLSAFYGVLEGYKRKGEDYELNFSSGMIDINGKEVFEKDWVEVHFKYTNGNQEKVSGLVEFVLGCFNVNNDHGLDLDLANCEGNLKIISNLYEIKNK